MSELGMGIVSGGRVTRCEGLRTAWDTQTQRSVVRNPYSSLRAKFSWRVTAKLRFPNCSVSAWRRRKDLRKRILRSSRYSSRYRPGPFLRSHGGDRDLLLGGIISFLLSRTTRENSFFTDGFIG